MVKKIFTSLLLCYFIVVVYSQSSINFYRFPYEIGVRATSKKFGVDGIIPFKFNRFRLNLGFTPYYYFNENYFDFKIHLYQKTWYAYVGVGFGINRWVKVNNKGNNKWSFATISEAGIERIFFKILCLALDVQMYYDLRTKEYNNFVTFSVRYKLLRRTI
ncbi:MAG: hypothetical protein N3A01_01605 [Bacteroidales bacterium]|nr:hypothetical protein [Bacteroidales bacterium]